MKTGPVQIPGAFLREQRTACQLCPGSDDQGGIAVAHVPSGALTVIAPRRLLQANTRLGLPRLPPAAQPGTSRRARCHARWPSRERRGRPPFGHPRQFYGSAYVFRNPSNTSGQKLGVAVRRARTVIILALCGLRGANGCAKPVCHPSARLHASSHCRSLNGPDARSARHSYRLP